AGCRCNPRPGRVHTLSGVTAISAGYAHNLAVSGDGIIWAWGSNNVGQLGLGDRVDRSDPQQVLMLVGTIGIAAGSTHTLALTLPDPEQVRPYGPTDLAVAMTSARSV